jgi:ABC-type dipeptide/oligopeptide/nickel transport system ATPase component
VSLTIRELAVSFPVASSRGTTRREVVSDASVAVEPGEMVAVVGESGSGKSITALSVLGLLPAGARIERGSIRLSAGGAGGAGGTEVELAGRSGWRAWAGIRGRRVAMIFQEPMTSLNPVLPVGEQVAEAVRLHRGLRGRAAMNSACGFLERVGIRDASTRMHGYPHEFSGGMRQRVMIAIALACGPEYLLADEPTTALDVTVQAQVMDLLGDLRRREGLGVMLITHDLALASQHASSVVVMQAGRVVESGVVSKVFGRPEHPYTRGLLASVPGSGMTAERAGAGAV